MRFGIVGQMGPRMRQVVRFGDQSSTGRGVLGGKCGTFYCNKWGVCRVAVCEPWELQFGVVRGVSRGTGVLDRGPHRAMGGFGGFYSGFLVLDFESVNRCFLAKRAKY